MISNYKNLFRFKDIKRIRSPRTNKKEYLRLDMAEKLSNYNHVFFKKFIKTLNQEDFITYPSYEEYENLKINIAKINKVKKNNVYIDAGSDACIKNLFHIISEKNINYVSSYPTFPMYEIYAKLFGIKSILIKYNLDRTLPIQKIIQSVNKKTRLITLPNPNSPYGDYKNSETISKLAKKLNLKNILLLIDEAYYEFAPGSCINLLHRNKNLLILRTFSKAWGAAGSRVGYILANNNIVDCLNKTQITYPITNSSLKYINYLIENKKLIDKDNKKTILHRDRLCDLLEKNNFDVLRSHTNTIHFHHKYSNNQFVHKIFRKYNVAYKKGNNIGTPIRVVNDKRNTWIRISVGINIHKQKYITEILNFKHRK